MRDDSIVSRHYPCRCCGFLTLTDPAFGSYEICPVCCWEDDPVQNDDPTYRGGANHVSLKEARRNYVVHGAAEPGHASFARLVEFDEIPYPALPYGHEDARHSSTQQALRRTMIGVARSIRGGRIGLVQGCEAIASMAYQADADGRLAEALRGFMVVASELDDYPLGPGRAVWEPSALAEKDARLRDHEERIRDVVIRDCARLESVLVAEVSAQDRLE